MIKFILVFITVCFSDFIWSKYIIHVSKGNAISASLYGASTYLIGSLITLTYIHDYKMIIPATLGALLGTYLSVRFFNKKD